MGLNQGRSASDYCRWIPGRGRPRGRARKQAPDAEPAPLPAFLASPVDDDDDDLTAGFAADLRLLSAGRSLGVDDRFALDSLLVSAERFITLFHSEMRAGAPDRRLWQVRREVERTGTYRHTTAELAFGARVAWRNSSARIGRPCWRSLRVRDRREVTAAPDIAAESVAHLREATNGGRIRPVITIFAPDAPGRPSPRIVSPQLVRYACHPAAGSSVTGDRVNAGLTRLAREVGWPGGRPGGPFDILPLLVAEPGGQITWHELPGDAVLEVSIRHPDFGWFADLGLRWYAVPVISDMYLDIGGVCFPAVPFNGWHVGTEVGARDLGDTGRYDQLPVIAERMGLSTGSGQTLWQDKAKTELNLAVLHSFGADGVTIIDHHAESVRSWPARPVLPRYYEDFSQTPNFYQHPVSLRLKSAARPPE
ncbi:MAG: nitric oxide synthase oxygenase [Streptosporangiaceae bacterium]